MARITVEDCLEKVGNRFALVQIASRRAKQLLGGAKPLLKDGEGKDNKSIVNALREIALGTVGVMTPEEIAEDARREEERKQKLLAELEARTAENFSKEAAVMNDPFKAHSDKGLSDDLAKLKLDLADADDEDDSDASDESSEEDVSN
jgi:DNA-directed RNA polymerase subunit omega